MTHPTIIDAERVYQGSLVATDAITLPSTFPIFTKDGATDDADLLVFLDGVVKPDAEWSFEGTFSDGIAAGGTVRLDAAVTATAVVYGAIAARRTTDFSAGNVTTAALNTEFDRQWACMREMQLTLQRCFKIPIPEVDSDDTPVDQVLPALATRAGQGLACDANGRPTVGTATALGAWLISVNALSLAANQFIYASGTDTAAKAAITSAARTLLAQSTQALMRTTGMGMSANGSSLVSAADYAAMRTLLGLVIGTDVEAFDADILKRDVTATLAIGYDATPNNLGTITTGTITPDPAVHNHHYAVNGGAHTLAPTSKPCSMVVEYLNNASAGAVTTSGFTHVDGAFTTTDTEKFIAQILVTKNYSYLNIVALQ